MVTSKVIDLRRLHQLSLILNMESKNEVLSDLMPERTERNYK